MSLVQVATLLRCQILESKHVSCVECVANTPTLVSRVTGAGTSVELSVNMVHASFQYTWEYQGNAPKLVRTPLTERCFLTLTQGMALGLGGNPYGPAGTGKTESVKALGQVCALIEQGVSRSIDSWWC